MGGKDGSMDRGTAGSSTSRQTPQTPPSISTDSTGSEKAAIHYIPGHDSANPEENTNPSRSVPSLIPPSRPITHSDLTLGGKRAGRGVRRSVTMDSLAATINSNISTSPSSTSFPASSGLVRGGSGSKSRGTLLVVEGLERASSTVRAALMQVLMYGKLDGERDEEREKRPRCIIVITSLPAVATLPPFMLDTFFWSHVLDPEEESKVEARGMVRNATSGSSSSSSSPNSSFQDRAVFAPEVIEEMIKDQKVVYMDPTLRAYCRDLVIALRTKNGVSGVTAKAAADLFQGAMYGAGWSVESPRGHRVKQLLPTPREGIDPIDRLDCIDQVIQEIPPPGPPSLERYTE
ncbi:hypothetical protein BJ684DRAFT_19620 [Piptocephalis cylindrospora]|uniref:Uncharacterized protein n=1 Tax=Piptocephalis cylindrospora TaxID=1907219 RepID=A0A4P9Y4R3_9FUNG|nr:hypothetical protein BJ684DRAFT_19620 [Piptocephalis cylindrospora]|eukprot:RKP13937.1 hypothetical protein BJ684DRAFT_19620 [Piptocephalis cylindrospora]